MDARTRQQAIEEQLEAIRTFERGPAAPSGEVGRPPSGSRHVALGLTLGSVAAIVSLAANALGAPVFDRRPMELIRVFLTFPLGERPLTVEPGLVLMVGCALFLATGAMYGALLHLVLSKYFGQASVGKQFGVATVLGLGLWVVNFYGILSWLQPLLLGGDWIVRLIPPWVGALTHLAFAWTVALGEVWGRLGSYRSGSPDRML